MDKLSVGEALSAGFRLVSREPLAFAGWLAVEFVLSMLPSLIAPLIVPGLGSDPAAMSAAAPLVVVLGLLVTLLTGVVLAGAILRASLEPDQRRYLYLRLGPQEGWLALTMLSLLAFWTVAAFVLVLAASMVVGVIAVAAGNTTTAPIISVALVYVVLIVASIWWFVRFGLALPIAFRERKVGLGEAWRASRGQAGRMFAVLGALSVLLLVAYAVIGGAAMSVIGARLPLADLAQTLQRDPTALSRALDPGAMTALGLMLILISGIARVVFFGTWADIYRQLRVAPAVDVFS